MSSINTLLVDKFARLDQHAPLLSARGRLPSRTERALLTKEHPSRRFIPMIDF